MTIAFENRHMSIRALALQAQRTGRAFAHPITWRRLSRERGWRRPRLRLYPAKPKIGVKATAPNEIWHIDASVLRLNAEPGVLPAPPGSKELDAAATA